MSDRPELRAISRWNGFDQLFQDPITGSFWLIGDRSVRAVTRADAEEYLRRHGEDTLLPEDDELVDEEPELAGDEEMADLEEEDYIPPMILVPDPSRAPGWADYDGDGRIDELFFHDKIVPNPAYTVTNSGMLEQNRVE
jgi:hypothetical protein